jgi:hypothetical protein
MDSDELAASNIVELALDWKTHKIRRINKACEEKDLETLVELATSKYGLLEDGYRRRACTLSLPFLCRAILTCCRANHTRMQRQSTRGGLDEAEAAS